MSVVVGAVTCLIGAQTIPTCHHISDYIRTFSHIPHPTPLPLTYPQVDDLKEKLAAQEVELKQKNDDADALIKRVGVEQEKVCTHRMLSVCIRMYIVHTLYLKTLQLPR